MKYTWLVEKYLEGELSGEALRKFELEILRKREVAEEVERVRSMNRFMKEQHARFQYEIGLIEDFEDTDNVIDEETIRRDLDGLKVRKINEGSSDTMEFNKKLTESRVSRNLAEQRSNKVLVRKISVWMAAASIAVLLAVSAYLFIGNEAQGDYLAAYEMFYAAPEADLSFRGTDPVIDQTFNSALREYDRKNYGSAFEQFNLIPEEAVPNDHYYKYKGISAMELGNFQVAIHSFAQMQSNDVLKHDGMWYTGLSYLAMEDIPAARAILEEIIATDGYYKKEAKKLLKSI
jgi:FimV-like protein